MSIERKRDVKSNILMWIVAVLLCATLFSMHFVGGLYARYTTGMSGSGSARVAEFNIEHEGTIFENVESEIIPGTTQTVNLIINNKSEVAMEYTLTVENMTGNLVPVKFKLNCTDEGKSRVITEKHKDGISINSVQLIPGEYTDNYTLNVVWEPSDDEEALKCIGMVDYITVSVTATQVD